MVKYFCILHASVDKVCSHYCILFCYWKGGCWTNMSKKKKLEESILSLEEAILEQKEEAQKDAEKVIRLSAAKYPEQLRIDQLNNSHDAKWKGIARQEKKLERKKKRLEKMQAPRQSTETVALQEKSGDAQKKSKKQPKEDKPTLSDKFATFARESAKKEMEVEKLLDRSVERRDRVRIEMSDLEELMEKEEESLGKELESRAEWLQGQITELKENWHSRTRALCDNRRQKIAEKQNEWSTSRLFLSQIIVTLVKYSLIVLEIIRKDYEKIATAIAIYGLLMYVLYLW